MCTYVCVCMYVYVWVYYKTMGEVGKIIAQLRWADGYGWVWVSSCHHQSSTVLFLGRLGIIVVCVCTRQHLIIGEMSCLYV